MFNTKYQEIRMQSIVFVTLRIPNNETEIPLTKKDRYRLKYICIESKKHSNNSQSRSSLYPVEGVASQTID